jgi:hypothetical protein
LSEGLAVCEHFQKREFDLQTGLFCRAAECGEKKSANFFLNLAIATATFLQASHLTK